jgi:Protein of unknown function (DUF2934)
MPEKEKGMKSELRNQTDSQNDGFADTAAAKSRPDNAPARTEAVIDDKAIRERAFQLYEESDREESNADEHWYQANAN